MYVFLCELFCGLMGANTRVFESLRALMLFTYLPIR